MKNNMQISFYLYGERRILKGCFDVLQEKEFLKSFNLKIIVSNELFFLGDVPTYALTAKLL